MNTTSILSSLSPEPQPVVSATFTADLLNLLPGQPVGLLNLQGASRYVFDIGQGGTEWGDSAIPSAPYLAGPGQLVLMDALDYSRLTVYPFRVVSSPAAVQFSVSPLRAMAGEARFGALGAVVTDQSLGVIDVPDGSGDLYLFTAAWPGVPSPHEGRPWGISRLRGRRDDLLASGEHVRADIEGLPPVFGTEFLIYPGTVTLIRRHGKPDRLLMLGFVDEYDGSRPVRGSGHWYVSDDYGLRWRYAGVAWEHSVSRAEWLSNNWKPYVDPQNPSPSGPWYQYLNGSGTLLLDGSDDLWMCISRVDGPIYGPGGDPRNWHPVTYSMVKARELCDAIDRDEDIRLHTRTFCQGGWNSPHNGPSDSFGRGNGQTIVRWNDHLQKYVFVMQDGNALYLSVGDVFNPSPPQLLLDYTVPGRLLTMFDWLTAGYLGKADNVFAVQTCLARNADIEARLETITVDFA